MKSILIHLKTEEIKWKNIAKVNIQYYENNVILAKEIQKKKINIKDSIHIACAIRGAQLHYRVPASHNRSVYAPLPSVAPGFHSPRSVGLWPPSHGSFHPHFASPGLATQALSGLAKRHKQPESYMQCHLKNIVNKYIIN
jgi:hypothetical protein